MQVDGNLVLYKCFNSNCPDSSGKRDIWASNSYGKGNPPYNLVIQRDNNLVIYDANKEPIWWNRLTMSNSHERVNFEWAANAYAIHSTATDCFLHILSKQVSICLKLVCRIDV